MEAGEVLVLENTRLYAEEVSLDDKPFDVQGRTHLVRNLANIAEAYVTDAFSAAHRSQPTLVGFTERLPSAGGRLFQREVEGVARALGSGERPVTIVLGGAKADDSVNVAEHVLSKGGADHVLTGGLVANVFLAARGVDIGEVNLATIRKELEDADTTLRKAAMITKAHGIKLKVPVDVVQKTPTGVRRARIEDIDPTLPILDIGVDTVVEYISLIRKSKTVIANGPMGVFEEEAFASGTREVYSEIGRVKGYTLLGGGHTGVVAKALGIETRVSHMSTGGGALITYLGGGKMPVLDALRRSKELYLAGQFALKPVKPIRPS
jgi:phosphoglycerate kinase